MAGEDASDELEEGNLEWHRKEKVGVAGEEYESVDVEDCD